VRGLPGLSQNAAQPLSIFAGHLSSDPHLEKASPTDVTPHLFFVLVKNRRTADRQRIMFWFNVSSLLDPISLYLTTTAKGGPGCSSFDGLMMENGPWRFNDQGQLTLQEGGWEEYTTMVYGKSRLL
jgi:carboxypeptidase D